jgi:hypothetical protein
VQAFGRREKRIEGFIKNNVVIVEDKQTSLLQGKSELRALPSVGQATRLRR